MKMSNNTNQTLPEHNTSNSKAVASIIPEDASKFSPFVHQGVFPFVKLPPEIRNAIYRTVVVSSKSLHVYCRHQGKVIGRSCHSTWKRRIRLLPRAEGKKDLGIFLVNRQFWNEASGVFYAENVFNFDLTRPGPTVNRFHPNLKRIRKCRLRLIDRALDHNSFECYDNRLVAAFAYSLTAKKQLEYLIIEGEGSYNALRPLESLRGIKHVHILFWMVSCSDLYCCRLQTLMMSNGEFSSIKDVTEEDTKRSEKAPQEMGHGSKKDKEFERMTATYSR